MSERAPDFNETDPGWVRLDVLQGLLGVKHAQLQRIRKQLGNAYEHGAGKPGKPVWVYAPLWLPARYRLDNPIADQTAGELRGKKKQEFFDGETAEAKYRVFIGELVAAKDVAGVFADIANEWSSALTSVQRTSPESADRLSAVLESAKQKVAHRFNGHSHENGSASASGHSDRHARSVQAVSSTNTKRVRRRRGGHPNR